MKPSIYHIKYINITELAVPGSNPAINHLKKFSCAVGQR